MARAGMLREKAAFERLTEGAIDDYGNVYSGWAQIGTRMSEMRETTGKEKIRGGALADVGSATLRVRSDSFTQTITAADRVLLRGYTWAIKSVIQTDAKNTMLEFSLERGVAT